MSGSDIGNKGVEKKVSLLVDVLSISLVLNFSPQHLRGELHPHHHVFPAQTHQSAIANIPITILYPTSTCYVHHRPPNPLPLPPPPPRTPRPTQHHPDPHRAPKALLAIHAPKTHSRHRHKLQPERSERKHTIASPTSGAIRALCGSATHVSGAHRAV